MQITCQDQKLRLLFDDVVRQINQAFESMDCEPFDLLAELASVKPGRAARLEHVVFGDFANGSSVAGCTSMRIGVSIEPEASFVTIHYSLPILKKLSKKAQQGVMVHELGHTWEMAMPGNYFAEQEADKCADEYACEWAFEEEIRQMYCELHGEIPPWLEK